MHIDKELEDKVHRLLQRPEGDMGRALGIDFLSFRKDEVKATMPVDENTVQPFGILHGGASVALAETLASIGAWLNIDGEQKSAVGIEINASHLRSVAKGETVTGTARPIHRGNQIHVWDITIETEEGKPVCRSRCTLAIVNNSRGS